MKTILIAMSVIVLCGCTDSARSKWSTLGEPQHIEIFSGGRCVGTWDSTGTVHNESQSDGYYFMDAVTHKNVRVCGTVVITSKP